MFYIIKFIENIFKYLNIKLKIFYWKLKYGRRIKIGKNVHFRKGMIINISSNGYLEIGDGSSFNNYCSINCHKKIIIGKNNLFGENVKIYDHNHIFNDKNINKKKSYYEREIYIGNENWFGSNTIILSKTYIGNNNVIAANVKLNEKYNDDSIITDNCVNISKNIVYKIGDNI